MNKTSDKNFVPLPQDAPQVGEIYRHYRDANHTYRIIGHGWNTSYDAWDVAYEPLYPCDHKEFHRRLSEWSELVEHKGARVPRYSKVP